MAEDLPAEEILKQISERLDLFERVLASNTARLHEIETHLNIPRQQSTEVFVSEKVDSRTPLPVSTTSHEPLPETPSEPTRLRSDQIPPPKTEPPPVTASPHQPSNKPSESHTYARRAAEAPFTLRPGAATPGADDESFESLHPEKHRDLESTIGGSWFNWIGIMAVIFGVAFFLKYAFDKQWIGPAGRISLSALVGIALLGLGERLRGRLRAYAYVLSGGGILILYLSVFAAYNFYHLISQPTAFLLMAVVTTTAVLLSVRLDALPVAFLGLVGGFLTPVLLSSGVDNQVGLFTYIALLDTGVLAVAYFKRWRTLDFASFAGTVLMTLGWAVKFYAPEKIWITIFFLSIFFLLYSLLAIFHNVLADRATRWFDISLAMANASFYFGLSYAMLDDAGFDRSTPATQALLISIYFTGLFFMASRWSPRDLLLRYSYVCAAATFFTLAVAIQLELHWVTIAWAVEALMLTWVGMRSGEKAALHAGLAVFLVAVGHWFVRDMVAVDYSLDASFLPMLNRRALSGAVLVGAIAAASIFYKRANPEDKSEGLKRATVLAFFAVTGNAVAFTFLSLDVNDYFMSQSSKSSADLHAPVEDSRQFSLSILWTIYAAALVAVGLLRRSLLLRAGGLLLFMVVIVKVPVVDSAFYAASWHVPLLNQTFMAYATLVAVLIFTSWLYRRAPSIDDRERPLAAVLAGAANLLALMAISFEVVGYYDRAIAGLGLTTLGIDQGVRQFEEGKLSTLTVVWTIYGLYAFMVGLGRKNKALRLGGLVLLAFTTALVLANLSYFKAPWHTLIFNRTMGVFAVFIAALWLVVRAYRRSSERFEEAAAVHHTAIVIANVLAIIALTAQAAGYYEARMAGEFARATPELFVDGNTSLQNLELAKQLSLSVIWAVYASGLLVAGYIRRLRLLRVMGLALLSITVVKVFIWDLSSLDRVYRIISFIMLGAILLVVSYFYQRGPNSAEESK